MKTEEKGLQLDGLKASSLPELQGWKEKQEKLVIDNPYVEIVDSKTYEVACKSRTNLLKGRTSLEGQEKTIASKLSTFRKEIGSKTKELIDITEPHENKQQVEVKRYENLKAQIKAEEEKMELERIEKIEKKITDFESDSYKIIQESNIGNVELHKSMLDAFVNDGFDYEEYEIMFEQAKIRVQSYWDNKCNEIQEKEEQRLENERMKREIFDVRVNRLKELGFELSDNLFKSNEFDYSIDKSDMFNIDSEAFEFVLLGIKESKEKAEQIKRDAEIKKQKDEQFEIRKNRLAEIEIFLIERDGEWWFDYKGGQICLFNESFCFNASVSEFEQLFNKAKNDIIKFKDKLVSERFEHRKNILIELGFEYKENESPCFNSDKIRMGVDALLNASEEWFENEVYLLLQVLEKEAHELQLKKLDDERKKSIA